MAEEITTSAANQGGAIGHIVRIVGPVVDVEFAPGQIPAIYNALTVEAQYPRWRRQGSPRGPASPSW